MREILFRGRDLSGQWRFGSLVRRCHRIDPASNYNIVDKYGQAYEVTDKTVGQYTSLTDKNGVKIFEGDIISYGGSRKAVYFDTSINIPCFTTGIGCGSSTGLHPYKISSRHVIIGNIHDDPELLR